MRAALLEHAAQKNLDKGAAKQMELLQITPTTAFHVSKFVQININV